VSSTSTSPRESPWPKREDRERERELKRDAVLETAVRLFNRNGFHATSLSDVADALNVTKPTIYHYFASKDEIVFECLRRGVEMIREGARDVERQGGNGMERLQAHMRSYAMVMTDDFGMCVTRTADQDLSEGSRKRFRAMKRETDQLIRRVIQEGIDDGSIAPGDPRVFTFTLAGALNWIARWYDPEGPLTREQIADGCVKLLVEGLAPRGS
jgi:AcrR family transcriptional regulator